MKQGGDLLLALDLEEGKMSPFATRTDAKWSGVQKEDRRKNNLPERREQSAKVDLH